MTSRLPSLRSSPCCCVDRFGPLHTELIALLRRSRPRRLAPADRLRALVGPGHHAHLLDDDLRRLSSIAMASLHRPARHRRPRLARGDDQPDECRVGGGGAADEPARADRAARGDGADGGRALPLDRPHAPAHWAVAWAGEETSAHWFDVGRDYTERWLHQQQIRDAVGAPPFTGREWLHPVLDLFVRAVPAAYRDMRPRRASTAMRLAIEGPAGGDWTLRREAAHLAAVRRPASGARRNGRDRPTTPPGGCSQRDCGREADAPARPDRGRSSARRGGARRARRDGLRPRPAAERHEAGDRGRCVDDLAPKARPRPPTARPSRTRSAAAPAPRARAAPHEAHRSVPPAPRRGRRPSASRRRPIPVHPVPTVLPTPCPPPPAAPAAQRRVPRPATTRGIVTAASAPAPKAPPGWPRAPSGTPPPARPGPPAGDGAAATGRRPPRRRSAMEPPAAAPPPGSRALRPARSPTTLPGQRWWP